jgi:hypothetical protein
MGGAPEDEDDGLAPLETLRRSLYSEDCLIVTPCSASANFSAAATPRKFGSSAESSVLPTWFRVRSLVFRIQGLKVYGLGLRWFESGV